MIYFSRQLMARFGVRNLFALGLLGTAVRLAGFAVAGNVWHVVPLQLLHSLTFGAFHCASLTYVNRHVPPHMNSTAQTLFAAVVTGLGGIAGGAVGGMILERHGFCAMYGWFALTALVSLVLLLVTVPDDRRG